MSDITSRISHQTLLEDTQGAWWDYLDLSMAERTERFIEAYRDAYRRHYARRTNHKTANKASPAGLRSINLEDLSIKTLNYIWKARQCADYIEAPYDVYCELAVNHADKCQWHTLTTPKHMSEDWMQLIVAEKWKEYIKYHLVLPQSPVESESFNEYLLSLSASRRHPKYLIKHLLNHALLTYEKAVALFGPHLTEEAFTL